MIFPDTETTRLRAAEIIGSGGVIAFRTDTFYGVGADPFNAAAVQRIKLLKGREDNKPILLLISDYAQVARVIDSQSEAFALLGKKLWPGPLTIIGTAVKSLPKEITAGTETVGVRLPGDQAVRDFVDICGGLLTATSANPAGEDPAVSARQVEDYFRTGLDLIIDGGVVSATQPSTVIDATENVRIVREGAVSRDAIERVLQR